MELYGYSSLDKITTYKFVLNKKTILLDYGAKIDNINNVDYIFITHEHFDHYKGILEQALDINENVKIYATKTTKLLLHDLISQNISTVVIKSNEKQRILKLIEGINEVIFENEYKLDNGLSFMFFPSGHTYGSAMVYLNGDSKILYTGDMDYHSKREDRRYYFDQSLEVDYLICDGTKLLDDEKIESADLSYYKKRKQLTFNVKPEKAVFLAQKFAYTSFFKEYKIYFDKDLKWFLDTIYKQGYNPFINNKILLLRDENDINEKSIILSSRRFEKFKKNNFLSLHIAKNDLLDFIYNINAKEVLIGHYDLNNPPFDFKYIKEGINRVWDIICS